MMFQQTEMELDGKSSSIGRNLRREEVLRRARHEIVSLSNVHLLTTIAAFVFGKRVLMTENSKLAIEFSFVDLGYDQIQAENAALELGLDDLEELKIFALKTLLASASGMKKFARLRFVSERCSSLIDVMEGKTDGKSEGPKDSGFCVGESADRWPGSCRR